jgi:hypothetical protein
MPGSQTRAEVRQQIHDQVQSAVQAAQAARDAASQAGQVAGGKGQATPVVAGPAAPLPPIPAGGGRMIIEKRGDQTVITTAQLPPELLPMAKMAQETALGLMGLLAAIFILGPFARMIARRDARTPDLRAAKHTEALGQQILQLQQSVDAMAIEVERISEAQRFQSKLLSDRSKG